jgi:hypothetical protein
VTRAAHRLEEAAALPRDGESEVGAASGAQGLPGLTSACHATCEAHRLATTRIASSLSLVGTELCEIAMSFSPSGRYCASSWSSVN